VGEVLRTVLDFERGRPDFHSGIVAADDTLLQQAYLDALDWAHATCRHLG
jgi:hypothetical protein